MTQNSVAGDVERTGTHGFELPAPPEGLTWSQVENPFTLKMGQFVLACRMAPPQPASDSGGTSPVAHGTEYGRIQAVIKPQRPEGANPLGYIHLIPAYDNSLGTRVLPTTPTKRESYSRASSVRTHIVTSGYIFFRLRRNMSSADVPGVEVPDSNTTV